MSSLEAPLVGVICDTESRGRVDVAVYLDGLLLVNVGSLAGDRPEGRTGADAAARLQGWSRMEILELDAQNEFIPRESIRRLVLRKRGLRRSLTIVPDAPSDPRRLVWKRARNDFEQVRELLFQTFGRLLVME